MELNASPFPEIEVEEANLSGIEDKFLVEKIQKNFQAIKDFANEVYPIPVETRLGLVSVNIYSQKDKTLIGQIDVESGEIITGQIDLYSGSVETDDFLPYTKRLRDFIMQPGIRNMKAQEQSQLFGIGKLNVQTDRIERFNALKYRYIWIAKKLDKDTDDEIWRKLIQIADLLKIKLTKVDSSEHFSKNPLYKMPTTLIKGDATNIATPAESIPAYYAIVELFSLMPSHNFWDGNKNKDYPPDCQTRDYSGDVTEKEKILRIIRDFDARFILSDTPSALDGPPVITESGYVLGGNSRTIAAQTIAYDNTDLVYDRKYKPELMKRLAVYGFKESDIKNMQFPFLARIIDIPISKCSTYSNMLNTGLTQTKSDVTEAIAMAKQMEEKQDTFENIASIFSENENDDTLRQLLNNPVTSRKVVKELESAGLITPSNTNSWLKNDTEFTDKGKVLLEYILLASILPDKTLLEKVGSYSGKIIRAIPQFIIMKSLPEKWNLINDVQEAVKLEYQRRKAGIPTVKQFLNQTSIDVQKVPERIALVWRIIEESKPTWFKRIIEKYINSAKAATGESMFKQKSEPEDLLKFYLKQIEEAKESGKSLSNADFEDNSTLNTQNSTLSDVISVPDEKLTVPELKVDEINSQPPTPNPQPPEGEKLPVLPTTNDILTAKTKGKPLILSKTKPLFGELLEPFSMLIYGKPGQGKTSLALILAQDLEPNGKSLYILADKGTIDTRLKKQLERLKISKNIVFYPSKDWADPGVERYLNDNAYKFVFIDKIGDVYNIKQDELKDLIEKYPDKSFIYLARTNKAGKEYIGDPEIGFKVDTIVFVGNMTAKTTEKHRDGETGKTMPVIQNKKLFDWRQNMANAS